MDSIIINEIPPLRAVWARKGESAEVPILGANRHQVLTAVLNIRSGAYGLYTSERYCQEDFQIILPVMHRFWRGWHIVLFLDKHRAHWAQASRALARQLGIQLRWLPTACSELNPVDHLWRQVTQAVLANEPTPNLDLTIQRMCDYLAALTPQERLHKAGVFAPNFWLADCL